MAADSNMGFHHGPIQSSFYNQHMVSFQSGSINSTSGMISEEINSLGGISITAGMILAGNPAMINNTSATFPVGNSPSNILCDPVPGLKHDTGLAVDWSSEELSILKEGLAKFADESSMMQYIKIASLLRDKTVRDVALRCRWMTKKENGKRRKPEEQYAAKKVKDRKEKVVDSSSKTNIHMVPSDNMAAYSQMLHHGSYNDRISCEVPAIDGATRHLLDENIVVLSQITANLATFRIQDNIDLLYRTRNNITTILNGMSKMPGIMSQMPPLPVSVDEELLNIILPVSNQDLLPLLLHMDLIALLELLLLDQLFVKQSVHCSKCYEMEMEHGERGNMVSFRARKVFRVIYEYSGTYVLYARRHSFEARAKMLTTYYKVHMSIEEFAKIPFQQSEEIYETDPNIRNSGMNLLRHY